jgi:integrase
LFGRTVIESLTSQVYAEMRKIGYTQPPYGLAQALHTAFLMERDPRLEAVSGETLEKIADAGPTLLRRGAARLSRVLSGMGLLDGTIDNYAVARAARRERETEYRATDDVPGEWAAWAKRWQQTATGSDSSREKLYFGVLKFARWLAKNHPGAAGPGLVTRDILIEYVAAVDRMKVGEWSNPVGNAARTIGKPLTATSKAALLKMIRRFFADLQEWEWVEKRFKPHRILAVPKPIASLIGPSPRVVADDIWAKIVWAGLNLSEADSLPRREGSRPRSSPFYPIELVRAVAHLWLFAGLRSDEIHRLGVGCIRWQSEIGDPGSPLCLLDVPTCKTATAFTKPVDALVGRSVNLWEKVRHAHPSMLDAKTGRMVHFLFVHRGRRVAKHYINETLIPLICAKAGVPREDARGPITCHRARATIATQLYNAKEPLSLFELKEWLGHADVRATQHYAALTPTKLTSAFRRAGYLERNLRSISVLLDGKAVREGLAALGEPWRYYDLGHGFCCYDFFDQCPHRMACVKCSFYGPKESARIQALEASGNLSRMLQEIPLRDEERAAVEDGAEAMAKLASGLRDTPAPDGQTPAEIAFTGTAAYAEKLATGRF